MYSPDGLGEIIGHVYKKLAILTLSVTKPLISRGDGLLAAEQLFVTELWLYKGRKASLLAGNPLTLSCEKSYFTIRLV